MEKILRGLVVLLILCFVLMGSPFLFQWYMERAYTSSLNSTFYYEASITTNSSLENITLFLPLPVDATGTSPIIESIGSGTISGTTMGWNFSIYGANNESLLKVWTDYLPPMIEGAQQVTYRFNSTAMIHTALNVTHPVEKGYTLQPKHHLPDTMSDGREALQYPLAYTYSSIAYVSYEAPESAMVEITVILEGKNSWYILRQYHNEYRDSLSASFQGSTEGWHEIDGVLITGVGDENPFWREARKRTVTIGPATSLGFTLHDIMSVRPLMSEWGDGRGAPHAVPVQLLHTHS